MGTLENNNQVPLLIKATKMELKFLTYNNYPIGKLSNRNLVLLKQEMYVHGGRDINVKIINNKLTTRSICIFNNQIKFVRNLRCRTYL